MKIRNLFFGGISSLILLGCQSATDFTTGGNAAAQVALPLPSPLSLAGLNEPVEFGPPADLVFQNILLTNGFTLGKIDYTNLNHEPVRLWLEGDGNLNLVSKLGMVGLNQQNWYLSDTVALSFDQVVVKSTNGSVQKIAGATRGFVDIDPNEQVSIEWRVHAVNPTLCVALTGFDGASVKPYSASLSGAIHLEMRLSRPFETESVPLGIGQKSINLTTANWQVMPHEFVAVDVCQGMMRPEFFQSPGWVEAGGNHI